MDCEVLPLLDLSTSVKTWSLMQIFVAKLYFDALYSNVLIDSLGSRIEMYLFFRNSEKMI